MCEEYIKQLETAMDTYHHLLDESQEMNDEYKKILVDIRQNAEICLKGINNSLKTIEDNDERSDRYFNFMSGMQYHLEFLQSIVIEIYDLLGEEDDLAGTTRD